MKKTLLIFVHGFPFENYEPFLENEYLLYTQYFEKIVIITDCKKSEKVTRNVDAEKYTIICDYTLAKDLKSIIEAMPMVLLDRHLYVELWRLFSRGKLTIQRLYDALVTCICGNHRALQAQRWIKANQDDYDIAVIYSYWLNIPAYAGIRLKERLSRKKKKICVISRAHGFDVYEERYKTNYLPFQEQICNEVDLIATASLAWKQYLDKKYRIENKTEVFYLGAADHGALNPLSSRDEFELVSCARVVPVKRLTKIVDALSLIKEHRIHWTHYGDGQEFEELKAYASIKLPLNVRVSFVGNVPNTQIYKDYESIPFHAFISVSATEAVPVSISEAISFGIPIIATAVGGVPELVQDQLNGYLIDKEYEDEELAKILVRMKEMPLGDYKILRQNARKQFELKFNAITNFRAFLDKLTTYEVK